MNEIDGKSQISQHLRQAVSSAAPQIEIISCDEILELAIQASISVVVMECCREKTLIEFQGGPGVIFCLARYQSATEFRKSFGQWAMSLRRRE